MKRAPLLLIATALLVLVAWLAGSNLWPAEGGTPGNGQPDDRVTGPSDPAVADPGDATPPLASQPLPPPRRNPSGDPPPFGTLRVHATDDGHPYPGVPVTVAPTTSADVWIDERTVAADHDGVAVLQLAPGDYHCRSALGGEAVARVLAGGTTEVELQLPGGATIDGRVTDPTGVPIADAEIVVAEVGSLSAPCAVARTDAGGNFAIGHVTGSRQVTARHRDYAPSAPQAVNLGEGQHGSLKFVLRRDAGTLQGVVVDVDDHPVGGAVLLIGQDETLAFVDRTTGSFGTPKCRVVSDAEGRFASSPLRPGDQMIRVVAAGHAPFVGTATVATGVATEVTVRLERGAVVRGVASLADGSAAVGARIWNDTRGSFRSRLTICDEAGRFELRDLPVGLVDLHAWSPPNLRDAVQLELDAGTQADWRPQLRAPSGGIVRGQVQTHDGRPLAGWLVTATSLVDGNGFGKLTDQGGEFAIDGLSRDDQVRLLARRPESGWTGFPDATMEPVAVDGPPVLLVVADPRFERGGIRGQVVDVAGKGVPATVDILHRSTRTPGSYRTNDEGVFAIDGLPAGDLEIAIRHPEHPRRIRTATLAPNAVADLGQIALELGGFAHGFVVDASGAPAVVQRIQVLDDDYRDAGDAELSGHSFRSPPLGAGSYELLVQAENLGAARVPIRITAGNDHEMIIRLRPGQLQRIQLTTDAARDLRLVASVLVVGDGGRPVWSSHAPVRNGYVEFSAWLEPGRYDMRASVNGLTATEARFAIEAAVAPPPVRLELQAR